MASITNHGARTAQTKHLINVFKILPLLRRWNNCYDYAIHEHFKGSWLILLLDVDFCGRVLANVVFVEPIYVALV